MSKNDDITGMLFDLLTSGNTGDPDVENPNVVDGLYAIAGGLHAVARALKKLGVNDAITDKGALEILSEEVHDGLSNISTSTECGLDNIAEALREKAANK
jgi:hypothetical protein